MTNKASLKIIYTSDIHGHALPINYGTNKPAELGLAKYVTIVQQIKKMQENVIVIVNGDLIQGTPFMTHYVKKHSEKANPMIQIMNQIGIDAGVKMQSNSRIFHGCQPIFLHPPLIVK